MGSLLGGILGREEEESQEEEDLVEGVEGVEDMGEDVLAALGLKSQEKLGWCSSTYSAAYDCRRVVPVKDCSLRFGFVFLIELL